MANYKVTDQHNTEQDIQADFYTIEEIGSQAVFQFKSHQEYGVSELVAVFTNPSSITKTGLSEE